MNTQDCKHDKTDEYGICVACDALTKPFPYHLWVMRNKLIELEKEGGAISDEEYAAKKAKLDYIKEYSIKNKLWHPSTYREPA